MAASFTVTVRCINCGKGSVTITNTTQAALGSWGNKPDVQKCPHCGQPLPVAFTSIALAHSGNVGSNTTITHTITEPATIGTAVS